MRLLHPLAQEAVVAALLLELLLSCCWMRFCFFRFPLQR